MEATAMKNKNVLLVSAFIVVISFVIKLMQKENILFSSGLDVNCQARFSFIAADNYISRGVLNVIFDRNGTGEFSLKSSFSNIEGNETFRISREVSFDYILENNNFITLSDMKTYKLPADNTSDDFFNKYIFDFSADKRKISVQHINNALVIGNAFSPTLMCVDRRSGQGSI